MKSTSFRMCAESSEYCTPFTSQLHSLCDMMWCRTVRGSTSKVAHCSVYGCVVCVVLSGAGQQGLTLPLQGTTAMSEKELTKRQAVRIGMTTSPPPPKKKQKKKHKKTQNKKIKPASNFFSASMDHLVSLVVKTCTSRAADLGSIPTSTTGIFHTRGLKTSNPVATLPDTCHHKVSARTGWPGASIMEADDHQVTTVYTVQPSFHHRHSTNRVSWSVTICRRTCSHASLRRLPTMVTLHDTRFVEWRWWNDSWTVVTWRSSASMIPAPGVSILCMGEIESLSCNFYICVAAHTTVGADSSLRYISMLQGH